MSLLERAALALLRGLDPERAHGVALAALRSGALPAPGPVTSPRLATRLAGMNLPNPIGLAAGFDKNAVALVPLAKAGFGFLEVGAATPHPQPGNPRPRLFRLTRDRAVINRFGFNNDGAEAIAARLAGTPTPIPRGLNLGANKDSPDRARDFAEVLRITGAHLDFATVNVSSPNTERLRDLQGATALADLLAGVREARDALPNRPKLFLKIAPDLTDGEIAAIARTAMDAQLDGLIATNTTTVRAGLLSPARREPGGLSGTPLFARSTHVLARLSAVTGGALPLIGVGGIGSAEDAFTKIRAGASAVQLYTALAYRGLGLAADIARGLDTLLERHGFATVAEATGADRERWT